MNDGSFKSFNDLVTWATMSLIEAITRGEPLRAAVYSVLATARDAKIKDDQHGS